MTEQNFEWICPRQECKKRIAAFTERGMRALADQHIHQHMREDALVEYTKIEPKKPEPAKPVETAITVFEERDYNILKLTNIDIGFLKTRGVQIDKDIVIEHGDYNDQVKRKGT